MMHGHMYIKNRLMVFKNRVVMNILGANREGVRGGWKKLYNEEFHDWFSSPNIVWVMN